MEQFIGGFEPSPRKYGFGRFAQVTINNPEPMHYVQESRDRQVIVLKRVKAPHLVEVFTHSDFHELVEAGKVEVDPHRFDEARQRLLALNPGVEGANDLPAQELEVLDFYRRLVRRVEEMRDAGETSLTDARMEVSIKRAHDELSETWRPEEIRARKQRTVPARPSPSTVRGWRRDLIEYGDDVLALRDGRTARGMLRAARITCPETREIMSKWVMAYLDMKQPTKKGLHALMVGEFKKKNLDRSEAGLPPLNIPSLSTFERAVNKLDKFEVVLARKGPAVARRQFKLAARREGAIGAGERVLYDNWCTNLMALKLPSHFWDGVSEELRGKLGKLRFWFGAAVCNASKVVLGMRLSVTPTAETSVRVLEMVCRDKSEIAKAAGCRSSWGHASRPIALEADSGRENANYRFRSTVRDLGALYEIGPVGRPDVRAAVERFFRTLDVNLMQHFTGRTGINVVDKGDWDPGELASVTVEVLTTALVRWVVDVHHNTPHGGLGGETPNDAWERLNDSYGVLPPPGPDGMRAIFGMPDDRKFNNRGVWFLGLNYRSKRLSELRMQLGDEEVVSIRVDHSDLGRISVRDVAENEWFTVPCDTDGVAGLSTVEWIEARRVLRRKHASQASLREDIVLEAIKDIRELGLAAAERAGIGPTTLTKQAVLDLEKELFHSFEIEPSETRGRALEGLDGADAVSLPEVPAADAAKPSSKSRRRRGPGDGSFLVEE